MDNMTAGLSSQWKLILLELKCCQTIAQLTFKVYFSIEQNHLNNQYHDFTCEQYNW